MPDHATPLSVRTHTKEPVPFLIYDSERAINGSAQRFTEKSAAQSGVYLENGYEVIQVLFGNKQI